MIKLLSILCLLVPSFVSAQTATPTKVVFLVQDVADGFDHAGATPELLLPLRDYIRTHHPEEYVPLNLAKLLKNRVEPYYIFNKRYCPPIGKTLGANLFIMSRLVMVGSSPDHDFVYDVQAKAYSPTTNREFTFLQAKAVPGAKLQSLVAGKEQSFWQSILSGTARQSQ